MIKTRSSKVIARKEGVGKPKAARAVSVSTHMSVSVREISNGYVISKYEDGPKGYKSTETFSATKPKIEIPTVSTKGKK